MGTTVKIEAGRWRAGKKNMEDRRGRRLCVHGSWHEPEMDLRYQSRATISALLLIHPDRSLSLSFSTFSFVESLVRFRM